MSEPGIQRGYLVLADLSGYTSFVVSTELEHAQGILTNLIGVLRRHLTPALDLVEVEGDALFLHLPERRVLRADGLLDLVESTYVAFRDLVHTMQRTARCPCQACQAIPSLDLKFVVHFGDYVLQDVGGAAKPFGTSVTLAHRLLKNSVTERTGWPAYVLLTESALGRMGIEPPDLHRAVATYPHLGDTPIGALDLRQRYGELTANRRVRLAEPDAEVTLRQRFGVAAPLLWDLLCDPSRRRLWEVGSDWSLRERPAGRSGTGTQHHCAISRFSEEVLDWRPFEYYTVRLHRGRFRFIITGELVPDGDGTGYRWSMRHESRAPRPVRALMSRLFAYRLMQMPERFRRLERLTGTLATGADPSAVAAPDRTA